MCSYRLGTFYTLPYCYGKNKLQAAQCSHLITLVVNKLALLYTARIASSSGKTKELTIKVHHLCRVAPHTENSIRHPAVLLPVFNFRGMMSGSA